MKKFFFVTDENGDKHAVNSDFIVQIKPQGAGWSSGGVIYLRKDSVPFSTIHISHSEAQKVFENLGLL